MASSTDRLYRGLLAYARFFSRGWGPVDTYERLLDHRHVLFSREGCAEILRKHPQKVSVHKVREMREGVVYEGQFFSPLAAYLPGLLPRESEIARFEMVLPRRWREEETKPVYIHLAGTGDHYFWRRRVMTVIPTLKSSGFGAVSLENPFYGSRKPPEQTRSQVRYVSDLFVMGMALILECMVIMHWLEGRGLGPVGLTGFSMGGHNCSLAAALWPKEVAVVPCLSWSTASSSFTEGLLSRTVCWDVLEAQLRDCHSGRDERRRECFRRIRELEISTLTSSTSSTLLPPHTSHPVGDLQTVGELTHKLWRLNTAAVPQRTTTQTHLCSSHEGELTLERGGTSERGGELREGAIERGPFMMASVHGVTSLFHMAQVSLAELREKVRRGREVELERTPELLETMRMVLDSWTHHGNFPQPLSPTLAHFVTAREDAYIPRRNLADVRSLWSGCRVEFVRGGHISTTLRQATAHKVLKQAMQRACSHQLT